MKVNVSKAPAMRNTRVFVIYDSICKAVKAPHWC